MSPPPTATIVAMEISGSARKPLPRGARTLPQTRPPMAVCAGRRRARTRFIFNCDLQICIASAVRNSRGPAWGKWLRLIYKCVNGLSLSLSFSPPPPSSPASLFPPLAPHPPHAAANQSVWKSAAAAALGAFTCTLDDRGSTSLRNCDQKVLKCI